MPKYITHVVYRIDCAPISKVYIGQTLNAESRKRQHFHQLASNSHPNDRLQDAYVKYGRGAFSFTIIERNIPANKINQREKYWINHYDSANKGFNLSGGNKVINRRPKLALSFPLPEILQAYDVPGMTKPFRIESSDIRAVENQIGNYNAPGDYDTCTDSGDTLYWCFVGKHPYYANDGCTMINKEGHMCCKACYAEIQKQFG